MKDKVKNIKPTKQEQVFGILDKQGYILDDDSAEIFGNDKIYCVSEHIRIWKKLNEDRKFFSDKKIIEKRKGYRCHIVRVEGQTENQGYKVGKEFFKEIDV